MIEPLEDQVLVAPLGETKTPGGIMLPDNAQDKGKIRRGTVLAVGPGKFNPEIMDGREPIQVEAGDMVLWGQYSGIEFDNDGRKLVLVPASEILGRVRADA